MPINGIAESEPVAVVDSNREALAAVSNSYSGVSVWEDLEKGIVS